MNTSSKPVVIDNRGNLIRYLCPKCKKAITFRRKYQGRSLCFECGQRLDWRSENDLCFETVVAMDSDEAAWIAKEYYRATGMREEERINITEMRNSLRGSGAELYLIFFDKKSHGKFMRSYAREGLIHDG